MQVLHNKALLAHLLPNLKGNKTANSAHGSSSKLHTALLDLLPVHLATPPVADAADSDQAVTSQSVPAQVNLATSLLVNGQALKALKLIAPICRAAFGLPDGVAIKAFCVAVEARIQIGALQVLRHPRHTLHYIQILQIDVCRSTRLLRVHVPCLLRYTLGRRAAMQCTAQDGSRTFSHVASLALQVFVRDQQLRKRLHAEQRPRHTAHSYCTFP